SSAILFPYTTLFRSLEDFQKFVKDDLSYKKLVLQKLPYIFRFLMKTLILTICGSGLSIIMLSVGRLTSLMQPVVADYFIEMLACLIFNIFLAIYLLNIYSQHIGNRILLNHIGDKFPTKKSRKYFWSNFAQLKLYMIYDYFQKRNCSTAQKKKIIEECCSQKQISYGWKYPALFITLDRKSTRLNSS